MKTHLSKPRLTDRRWVNLVFPLALATGCSAGDQSAQQLAHAELEDSKAVVVELKADKVAENLKIKPEKARVPAAESKSAQRKVAAEDPGQMKVGNVNAAEALKKAKQEAAQATSGTYPKALDRSADLTISKIASATVVAKNELSRSEPSKVENQLEKLEAPKVESKMMAAAASTVASPKAEAETSPMKAEMGTSEVVYIVQVGMFKSKENAEGLVAKLKGLGFPALLKVQDSKGSTFYVVRLEPTPTKAEADKWVEDLKSQVKMSAIISKSK